MGQIIKLKKGKKLAGVVDKEPEVEEDPFEIEEEKEDKKKKKKKKSGDSDEENNK